jgi:hypothetical protein
MPSLRTIWLLPAAELDLHEADILADLPALSNWAIAPATPASRELIDELPAYAGLQESQA